MAFEDVVENFEECGTDDRIESIHTTGHLTRVFDVRFTAATPLTERQVACLSASAGGTAIPAIDAVHPYDNHWICRARTSRPQNGGLHWKVYCTYEYRVPPLTEEPVIVWDFAEHMEMIEETRAGNKIETTSREPLDPPLTEPYHDLVLRVDKNYTSYDALTAADYMNSVNLNVMQIDFALLPAYTMLLSMWKADKFYWGETAYWKHHFEFMIRLAKDPMDGEIIGWRRRIADQGFYSLAGGWNGNPADKQRLLDRDGEPVTTPQLLNGFGGVLPDGDPPVFNIFETKKMRDFSIFQFT